MTTTALHERLTEIDGLIISNWSRGLFEAMRDGGLTAANCTCSIWEGFEPSMRAIGQWKQWSRDNTDIMTQVYGVNYIAQAKADSKVGGSQSTDKLNQLLLRWWIDPLHLISRRRRT
jgi:membrane dipeptidase